MLSCVECSKRVESGEVLGGDVYCKRCAWDEKNKDAYIRRETEGSYTNYEDYVEEELGATVIGNDEYERGY